MQKTDTMESNIPLISRQNCAILRASGMKKKNPIHARTTNGWEKPLLPAL
jgi:hypothetical protein